MIDSGFDTQSFPSSENPMQARKNLLWQNMSAEFSQMTDGLGKGIDEGIMDTVVGLNILGITTRQSCEGHMKWGTGSPWVDIEAKGPEVEELKKKALQAWDAAKKAESEHAPDEEINIAFGEAYKVRREEKAEHLKVAQQVMIHLDEFYRDRQVPYDRRLVLTHGATRLESQGAAFQEVVEPGIREQKLTEYQGEMKAFSDFLKKKFYADETSTESGEAIVEKIKEKRLTRMAERVATELQNRIEDQNQPSKNSFSRGDTI